MLTIAIPVCVCSCLVAVHRSDKWINIAMVMYINLALLDCYCDNFEHFLCVRLEFFFFIFSFVQFSLCSLTPELRTPCRNLLMILAIWKLLSLLGLTVHSLFSSVTTLTSPGLLESSPSSETRKEKRNQ